jgi:hypothetical protein
MRYKTFRNLSLLGGVAAAGTLGYFGARSCSSRTSVAPTTATSTSTPTAPARPVSPPAATKGSASTTASAGETPLREVDRAILELARTPLGADKKKDALPGRPYKVNLYQDAGQKKVNRLKMDLDRDDKWDEKWTFEEKDGKPEVKRQVAPADDEQYTEEYRLHAGRWVKKR